jgi:cysteine desulfurase
MTDGLPLYLDDAATTMLDPAVRDAMLPWMGVPANPHIRHHAFGIRAAAAVKEARAQVATAIGAQTEEIVFTSGATESSNMLIAGLVPHLRAAGRTHIVTTAVEHASILSPLKSLPADFTVSILDTQKCAMIEAEMIERALTLTTGLVTVQGVNNVTGTIQPLDEISAVLKGHGILFHTDAAQAVGKTGFDVNAAGIDAASLCAHKIFGPAGIGALYLRKGTPLASLLHGGGQEGGLRPGTLPVALCAGLGAACARLEDRRVPLQAAREDFIARLAPLKPEIFGHRDPAWNVPGILCLRFPGIDHETLLMALPELAFSIGSACGAAGGRVHNHVITAIAGPGAANEAIRLSFGRLTAQDTLRRAADMIFDAVTSIRQQQEAA